MATPKKFFSIVIVLFIGLSLVAISQCYAGEGKKRGKATEYLDSRPENFETDVVSGTIMKITQSGDRMYLKVDTGNKKKWAAIPIPDTNLEVGDTVTLQPGIVMKNIRIKGLKRNFKEIVFSEGL